MQDYFSKVLEAVAYINEKISIKPDIGIILGSGLGRLADQVMERVEILYEEIPNFPASKVIGHSNRLVIGKIYDKNVIIMQGRFHYYEGYDMDEVAFPVKVLSLLGVSSLIVSNAAGGLNTNFKYGDIMLIKDHINLSGLSPLRGENIPELGTRFPNMKGVYSTRLITLAKEQYAQLIEEDKKLTKEEKNTKKKRFGLDASKKQLSNDLVEQLEEYGKLEDEEAEKLFTLREGIYAFMPGPQYETDAEIKMLSLLGADAVGMSTVPEVISAAHSGIEVLGISCITNECLSQDTVTHDEVLKVASQITNGFVSFVMRIIRAM